ncbi:MAG TPA: hypothetical protein VIW25_02955 [Nitrososphaeraceae archaeon]|jgi:hypothetical protein
MSLDMFPSMFSQRSGIDQSVAGIVINAIMGHMTQQGGVGNLYSQDGYGNYTDEDRIRGIQSTLSSLGRGGIDYSHPLVQRINKKQYPRSTAGSTLCSASCSFDE